MRGHFLQSSEGEVYAEGAFYIDRPGKMRVQYDPPMPFFMVASGSTLSFYDGRLKKATYVPIDMTPAYFLIRDKVGLGDAIVASQVERGDASLRITVHEREHPDRGRMLLTFSDRPLELKKWKMIDHDGNETDISIVNTEYNVKLDPNLFKFVDPSPSSSGRGSSN
jgi:outer membrane lipoprotein-sorting protein